MDPSVVKQPKWLMNDPNWITTKQYVVVVPK